MAFCQSILETGWFKFGGQVLPEQYNYGGIGSALNLRIQFSPAHSCIQVFWL